MTSTRIDPRALDYDPGRVVCTKSAAAPTAEPEQPFRPVRVADLMTTPAPTTEPDAPLLEIVHRLISQEESELIVAVGKRPSGVITARHIIALLEPDYADWRPRRAIDLLRTLTPSLLPDLTVSAAAVALTFGGHDALPVVDYRGDLIGVLAQRHLVAHLAHGQMR